MLAACPDALRFAPSQGGSKHRLYLLYFQDSSAAKEKTDCISIPDRVISANGSRPEKSMLHRAQLCKANRSSLQEHWCAFVFDKAASFFEMES